MKQPKGNTSYEASFPVQLMTAGFSACIADFLTFPLDTAKVRLQVQGESNVRGPIQMKPISIPFGTAVPPFSRTVVTAHAIDVAPKYSGLYGTVNTIVRREGVRALYNGLSAGLQRQMCFASIRLGCYDGVKSFYGRILREREDGMQIVTRVFAGLTTGGMAVMCGQPFDIVKVRMQAQVKGSGFAKPKYSGTLMAYRTIAREEGISKGLWKGAVPNVGRNAIVNVAEIVCYDVVKDLLILHANMADNIKCHFTAATIAGFFTTVCASPIDVVKTRYMNSKPNQYAGAVDCAIRMATNEGAQAFFKGFVPSFCRIVSWNICLWITYEQLKKVVFNKVEHHD
uniref:CSON002592 protein n=1 Tax=Culicoides sonorensis TaxID=179676 RepID=A0A336L1S5_CULSO